MSMKHINDTAVAPCDDFCKSPCIKHYVCFVPSFSPSLFYPSLPPLSAWVTASWWLMASAACVPWWAVGAPQSSVSPCCCCCCSSPGRPSSRTTSGCLERLFFGEQNHRPQEYIAYVRQEDVPVKPNNGAHNK